uniref:H/ACA ribonucleoprotein complex subunit n=1 Tax=Echinostoma caproni TaxID=27848 RepID=A0A183BC22_9TREM
LENKEEVGKVDDIFGPIKDAVRTEGLSHLYNNALVQFYMDPYKFLPLERVLNPNASRGECRSVYFPSNDRESPRIPTTCILWHMLPFFFDLLHPSRSYLFSISFSCSKMTSV